MSVRVMSAVWELNLPDSQKLVLLALADCASDEGRAWPSIATIARKCSRGVRTVQGVMIELEKAGHITRDQVAGKGCNYIVHPAPTPAAAAPHPRSRCTPAAAAPPQPTAPTPAAAAPKPSRTILPVQASPSQEERARESEDRLTESEVVEAWNATADRHGLPRVRLPLSRERRVKLRARIGEHPLDDWKEAFAAIGRSRFLRGEEGNWRGAHFDFLLQPSSFQKMIEGVYDGSTH